jgi:hypothetical protein
MTYDPLSAVVDAPISVSDGMIRALNELRGSEKFLDLPGEDTTVERQRLTAIFNGTLDKVISGLKSNPRKQWFMAQIQPALAEVANEDTEARERFGMHIEKVMDIVEVDSSDGMLSFYLGGI